MDKKKGDEPHAQIHHGKGDVLLSHGLVLFGACLTWQRVDKLHLRRDEHSKGLMAYPVFCIQGGMKNETRQRSPAGDGCVPARI